MKGLHDSVMIGIRDNEGSVPIVRALTDDEKREIGVLLSARTCVIAAEGDGVSVELFSPAPALTLDRLVATSLDPPVALPPPPFGAIAALLKIFPKSMKSSSVLEQIADIRSGYDTALLEGRSARALWWQSACTIALAVAMWIAGGLARLIGPLKTLLELYDLL